MNAPNKPHDHQGHNHPASHCHCCPDGGWHQQLAVSRRGFLTTAAVGGAVLTGLSWTSMSRAAETALPMPPAQAAEGAADSRVGSSQTSRDDELAELGRH